MNNRVRPKFRPGQIVLFCGPGRMPAAARIERAIERRHWQVAETPEYAVYVFGGGSYTASAANLIGGRRLRLALASWPRPRMNETPVVKSSPATALPPPRSTIERSPWSRRGSNTIYYRR